MNFDEPTITRFLSLFEITEGHSLLLWFAHPQTQEKKSLFVSTVATAVEALRLHQDWNCYWGVALRPFQPQPRPHWRGTEQDVTALLCLHLDIDIYNLHAHKSSALPKTIEEALQLLRSLPIQPTAIADSGYGLHAYYIFKEPELLAETQERNFARDVAQQLYAACYHLAHISHWRIDKTTDLSRIIRVPGTINWKITESPKLSSIIGINENDRYASLSDLSDALPYTPPIYDSEPTPTNIISLVQNLRLTGGQFSFTTLKALCANDKKFDATWERRRADFRDGSQSAYDFSLILQALNAGLSAQDTLSLIELFRREQRASDKPLGYYKFSIRNALLQISKGKKEKDAIETIVAREEQATIEALDREQRDQDKFDPQPLFRDLEIFLEFPDEYRIEQVLRIESEPLQHEILVNCPDNKQRRIQIDSPSEALDWSKIKARVLQVTSRIITKGNTAALDKRFQQRWYGYFNRLRDIAIDYQVPESFNSEIVRNLLEQYATKNGRRLENDNQEIQNDWMLKQLPFFLEKTFWFSLSKFMDYANRHISTKPYTVALFSKFLYQVQANKTTKSFRVDDGVTSRKYWSIAVVNLMYREQFNGKPNGEINLDENIVIPKDVTRH